MHLFLFFGVQCLGTLGINCFIGELRGRARGEKVCEARARRDQSFLSFVNPFVNPFVTPW